MSLCGLFLYGFGHAIGQHGNAGVAVLIFGARFKEHGRGITREGEGVVGHGVAFPKFPFPAGFFGVAKSRYGRVR